MKIAKQFHWEMGHRLPFHKELCANIHGHSYRMWVELEGVLDPNGMLLDYGILKEKVKPIIDEIDHAFMCDENDDVMKQFLAGSDFKHVMVSFTTTAEHISEYLIRKIWFALQGYTNLSRITVRIHETETAMAETSLTREEFQKVV